MNHALRAARRDVQRYGAAAEARLQDHRPHRRQGEQGEARAQVLQVRLALQEEQDRHVWLPLH